MEKLRSDSPECRRIVSAFLDFLSSVEPAPDVDLEGLEVARECLQATFELNRNNDEFKVRSGLLLELFRSVGRSEEDYNQSECGHKIISTQGLNLFSPQTSTSSGNTVKAAEMGESMSGRSLLSDVKNDELFGQFCGALERVLFFNPTLSGDDDHVRISLAKRVFDDALMEVEKSGRQINDVSDLAETIKSLGNQVMSSGNYKDAVEFYTCAIALQENNAVYYCNRAAAHTQLHNYDEAILDCKKAIMINPNYIKAYSRLGMAYYGLGNYRDAIDLGYSEALALDPNNSSILANIRVAEHEMRDEQRRTEGGQNSGASDGNNQPSNGSWRWVNGDERPFTHPGNLPSNIAEVFADIAATAYGAAMDGESNDASGMGNGNPNGPEIRMGGNMPFNFDNANLPEEMSSVFRTAMNMFNTNPSSGSRGVNSENPSSGAQGGNSERDSSSRPN